jgi:hypothetical protein
MKEEQIIKDIQATLFNLNYLPKKLQPKTAECFNYPPETEREKQYRHLAGNSL